jgi:uncharacterized protein (TIGR02996 family)
MREDRQAFIDKLIKEPNDITTRKVFADWLEDNDPTVHPKVLDRLRNYDGDLHIGLSPTQRVLAIPSVTKKILEERLANNKSLGPFFHRTSRNRRGEAHPVRVSGKLQTWKRDPTRFRLPWKYGLYQSGEINPGNSHEWLIESPVGEPE